MVLNMEIEDDIAEKIRQRDEADFFTSRSRTVEEMARGLEKVSLILQEAPAFTTEVHQDIGAFVERCLGEEEHGKRNRNYMASQVRFGAK
jgi:hypothetical protein